MIIKNIRDAFKTYDSPLIYSVLIATVMGLVFIYSATRTMGGGLRYMAVQLGTAVVGFIIMYLITKIDYEDIADDGYLYRCSADFCWFWFLL